MVESETENGSNKSNVDSGWRRLSVTTDRVQMGADEQLMQEAKKAAEQADNRNVKNNQDE